jgi:hypothetical protein
MSSRTQKIVSGLAALGTTALLLPAAGGSFDGQLQAGSGAYDPPNAIVALVTGDR